MFSLKLWHISPGFVCTGAISIVVAESSKTAFLINEYLTINKLFSPIYLHTYSVMCSQVMTAQVDQEQKKHVAHVVAEQKVDIKTRRASPSGDVFEY